MVLYGTIAQMEERQVEALRVEGSIPSCPTKAGNGSLLFHELLLGTYALREKRTDWQTESTATLMGVTN